MSYDIQVWSVEIPDTPGSLPKPRLWKPSEGSWSLERRSWQIVCGTPDFVLSEDVPEVVSAGLPGISYLTQFNLEPLHASGTAREELLRAAGAVAKASHGLVYDPQTGELTIPKGVKRFVPERRSERFALLELGWWFLGDHLFTPAGMESLLDVLVRLLPDALPQRYGLYEPPQHLLAKEGRGHLSEFLLKHMGSSVSHLVLYPHRPVMSMDLLCTKDHHSPLGFRCNRISVGVEASVIAQPGWHEGIRRFWLALCDQLNPFYAESRTLQGYVRRGATFGSNMATEVHPLCSWSWRGLPRELGHAVAIGSPYIGLWPRVQAEGQARGNLVVLDAGRWVQGNNLTVEVPEGIRQEGTPGWTQHNGVGWTMDRVTAYPRIWPFQDEQRWMSVLGR